MLITLENFHIRKIAEGVTGPRQKHHYICIHHHICLCHMVEEKERQKIRSDKEDIQVRKAKENLEMKEEGEE